MKRYSAVAALLAGLVVLDRIGFSIAAYETAIVAFMGTLSDGYGEYAADESALISTAYPNPFNPTTTITYNLPQTRDVELSVFDVLGRRVQVLFSGHQDAGVHTATFDASTLPSGLYLYRLAAGDHVEANSILLVK